LGQIFEVSLRIDVFQAKRAVDPDVRKDDSNRTALAFFRRERKKKLTAKC
jgi:hypothetical protein